MDGHSSVGGVATIHTLADLPLHRGLWPIPSRETVAQSPFKELPTRPLQGDALRGSRRIPKQARQTLITEHRTSPLTHNKESILQ